MKRRGMYRSGSFFKPFIAPAMSYSLNRLNDDWSRARPYDKGRLEYNFFARNNGWKEVNSVFPGNSDFA